MRQEGPKGWSEAKPSARSPTRTRPDPPIDRSFEADRPDRLWLSDITYVRRVAYVALVIDAYSRFGRLECRTVYEPTWLSRGTLGTATRHSLPRPAAGPSLRRRRSIFVHSLHEPAHRRVDSAGIEPSVGSVGDSYDNALAESVIGLYKTELIHKRAPWKDLDHLEYATLEYVDWFNHRRLLEPIGDIPPAEKEANYHQEHTPAPLAGVK